MLSMSGTNIDTAKFKAARLRAELTQAELAAKAGVSLSTVWKVSTGQRGASVPTLRKLARAMGVHSSDLRRHVASQPATPAPTTDELAVA